MNPVLCPMVNHGLRDTERWAQLHGSISERFYHPRDSAPPAKSIKMEARTDRNTPFHSTHGKQLDPWPGRGILRMMVIRQLPLCHDKRALLLADRARHLPTSSAAPTKGNDRLQPSLSIRFA